MVKKVLNRYLQGLHNGDYIGDWVLLERIKMNFNVSPPVEFTNLVHQSSPLVQSSDCRLLNFSSQSSVLL